MQRLAQDLEFVRVRVAATDAGDVVIPTGDPVSFAFVPQGSEIDGSTTFASGNWETDDSIAASPVYYARILVGPGGTVTLTSGVWDCYLKVTDNPEVVVKRVGTIWVT